MFKHRYRLYAPVITDAGDEVDTVGGDAEPIDFDLKADLSELTDEERDELLSTFDDPSLLIPDDDSDDDEGDVQGSSADDNPFADDDSDDESIASYDEIKARTDGWVSKEEWVASGKPADQWVTASEFNFRGNLMGQIHRANKENETLRKQVHNLLDDFKVLKSFQREQISQADKLSNEQKLRDLRVQLAEARDEEDYAKIEELEDAILSHKVEERLGALTPKEDETTTAQEDDADDAEEIVDPIEAFKEQNPEEYSKFERIMNKWTEANSWYSTDPVLTKYAEQVHATLLEDSPMRGMDDAVAILKKVQNAVRNAFPTHAAFSKRPPRKSPLKKQGGGGVGDDEVVVNPADFPKEVLKVGREWVRMRFYENLNDFLKDL